MDPFGSTSSADVLRPDLWLVGYGLDVLGSVGSVQIGCGQLCHAVPKEWLCITVWHAPDAMASFAFLSLAGTGIARS